MTIPGGGSFSNVILQCHLEAESGLDLTDWHLQRALAVSADGGTIVGLGINPSGQQEAWIAQLGLTTELADLNGDGDVDGLDLAALLASWGACPKRSPCPVDLNGDGMVNGIDVGILLVAWT